MSNFNFEPIAVAAGAYVSWAPQPGQVIVGKVLAYNPTGGTDFNENVCPQLELELVADAYSVNKDGERFDHAAGDVVVVNGGQANLKRGMVAARLATGDVVKITFDHLEKSAKGSVKVFTFAVARGAAFSAVDTSAEAVRPF